MEQRNVVIHAAGACTGSKSPGGFSATVELDENTHIMVSGGDPETNVNRMDLTGIIKAVQALNEHDQAPETTVVIRTGTGTEYVSNAFNRGWLSMWKNRGWRKANDRPLSNQDLWKELEQVTRGKNISCVRVPSTRPDPDIERCNGMAIQQANMARNADGPWTLAKKVEPLVPGPETSETHSPHDLANRVEEAERKAEEALSMLKEILSAAKNAKTAKAFMAKLTELEGPVQQQHPGRAEDE